MKKKVVALSLCVAMLAIAIVGGTFAYFTDTDSAKNVMTTGNVKIEQVEKQNVVVDGEFTKTMENFEDGKAMFPVVKEYLKPSNGGVNSENWSAINYCPADTNAISKYIAVKNVGTEDAYIRTIILFEMGKVPEGSTMTAHVTDPEDGSEWVHLVEEGRAQFGAGEVDAPFIDTYGYLVPVYEADKVNGADVPAAVKVDDVWYSVYQGIYNYNKVDGKTNALLGSESTADESGEYTSSYCSLGSFWLRHDVGNEFYAMVGDDYNVLALSQACQMAGFDSAEEALDTSFGDFAVWNGGDINRITEGGKALIEGWFADVE